ncbi:MAG TPA: penicillin acylase family protein, partial [Chryseosolibacter sp.]|nr:penicillin acylase family protein [Chryseosolibacter sp.]
MKGPVTVAFDSLMIPHIFAENDDDLYLAQGYVTAMHRLWQMEFQTHAAAGRVSEIISGPAILNFDRTQRRLGMVYGAEKALAYMAENDTVRRMVEQYTAGINQYIQSLEYENLPFEYKLLDYKPEAWTPLKCALLLKNMAQTLNIGDKDIEMTNALKLFGKNYVDLLYPDYEDVGDPIVDNAGKWAFEPVSLDTIPLAVPEEFISITKAPGPDPTTGSNNWAVAGTKTATGAPILCNDPHLNLQLPSIWYVIQLHAPGVNAMGASLPGAPGVVIGFNDSIAWGMTNAQRDLVDWYRVSYENGKREKYKLGNEWVPVRKVIEEFRVKDGKSFFDTVSYTTWGPVTYDQTFHAEKNLKDYAFRWIAHDRSEEIMTLYKLNRAKNFDQYMRALDHFASPAQNFVFASVSGDIAIRIQGKFPVRRPNEGKFVLDGSNPENGWLAFIPNDQNILQKNPPRGFVSSANQYPADKTYPYFITATSYEAYRNRRINALLNEKNSITPQDMVRMQSDNYNLKAAESLPVFLSHLDTTSLSPGERIAYRKLKAWDYFNTADSEAASYYEAWWDALMPLVWDEMKREDLNLRRPTTFTTIKLIRDNPAFEFFDRLDTKDQKETARDVLRKAFSQGVKDVAAWMDDQRKNGGEPTTADWASFKGSFIGHVLPPLRAMSIPVRTGGNHDIVNAHSRTHGPSWRMVVSLEKSGVKAWGTYPGGQSGNPGSRFYDNLL